MKLEDYLLQMPGKGASDLYLSSGALPMMKIEGRMGPVGSAPMSAEQIEAMAWGIMNERQRRVFEETLEMNLALALDERGRYRINIYRQRGQVSMVARFLTARIPSIESLNLPPILKKLVMAPRGLVLVVGASGAGKSTTLASMLDHRNRNSSSHILTVEDPIEYVHEHHSSVVDQRELGLDTLSYESALKNAMREAPDVILIGEIRDRETMLAALTYADTGHLCLSTLHASNASQALDRIMNFFPDSAHQQVLIDLANNLQAIISMRLLPGVNGCRLPAVEIMLNTPHVSDLILRRNIAGIHEAIQQGRELGMQSFDQALFELVASGQVALDEALQHADSRTDLSLRIRLQTGNEATGEGFSLETPVPPRGAGTRPPE